MPPWQLDQELGVSAADVDTAGGGGTDLFGKTIIAAVWPKVMGGETPTPVELQLVQAISRGEGYYGKGTYKVLTIPGGEVVQTINDSNNWGAVQCPVKCCPCPEGCFNATDSYPGSKDPNNPKGLYQACFRRHATPEEGCAHYLQTLMKGKRAVVREAIRTGSALLTATRMYDTTYYQSWGPTREKRIENYTKGIMTNAGKIAEKLGEPLLVTWDPQPGPGPTPSSGKDEGLSWVWIAGLGLGIGWALMRRRG